MNKKEERNKPFPFKLLFGKVASDSGFLKLSYDEQCFITIKTFLNGCIMIKKKLKLDKFGNTAPSPLSTNLNRTALFCVLLPLLHQM